ncbi:MAG: glycosyltransferase [Vulcanimicrobiota bacterium]
MKVYAAMIVGKRPEVYLASCLESICNAVDELVLNDNSGEERSENKAIVENSRLFREKRATIIPGTFQGFSYCRNIPIEHIRQQAVEDCWILRLDADEVHTPDLAFFTRNVLPHVPASIGGFDAYYYKFMISLDFITFIERRHQWLVRMTPELHWEGDVHEKLIGVREAQVALPYVYCDYSYVLADTALEKWKMYHTLGDPTYSGEELEKMDYKTFLNHEVHRCFRFKGAHPPGTEETLEKLRDDKREDFNRFNALCQEYLKHPLNSLKSNARLSNFKLRVFWRAIQCALLFRKASLFPLMMTVMSNSNRCY